MFTTDKEACLDRRLTPEQYKAALEALIPGFQENRGIENGAFARALVTLMGDSTVMQMRWAKRGAPERFISEASAGVMAPLVEWGKSIGYSEDQVIQFLTDIARDIVPLVEQAMGIQISKITLGSMKTDTQGVEIPVYENPDAPPQKSLPSELVEELMKFISKVGDEPDGPDMRVFVAGKDGIKEVPRAGKKFDPTKDES